ncbi:hypothetical protein [Roseovarius sp. ZX-A-9]|uniref:hypothetical protein n=1 Tax=Roseovarius sp. ZX-A-9 TaxID=3014783 RepID=UPI003FA76CE7
MIDWSRVAELRSEIGAEDFDEVVELFLEEVEAEISVLRAGCPPKNGRTSCISSRAAR